MEPGSFTMRVTNIVITEPWKASHAGTSFVPKLLPSLHAAMQSCQTDSGTSLNSCQCFAVCCSKCPYHLHVPADQPKATVCAIECFIQASSLHYAGSPPADAVPAIQGLSAAHMQQRDLTRQPLCKYWVNTGRCLRGDTCQYQHVTPSQLPELRQGWVTAR